MSRMPSFALFATVLFWASAPPTVRADFLFQGQFSRDDSVALFRFDTQTTSRVTIQTLSYAGAGIISSGGFDPALAVFDSSGLEIASNDDGGALVNPSPLSGASLDSYISLVSLPAGTYFLALTQSPNLANGPSLLDGFAFTDFSAFGNINQVLENAGGLLAGSSNFTCEMFLGQPGPFCDVLLEKLDASYAVDITGVASAEAVPEPPSIPLLATAFSILTLLLRRRAPASGAGHQQTS